MNTELFVNATIGFSENLFLVSYTVFYRIHAPPQIDAPPKFFDHVPEDSSSKIYRTTLFNDRFNAVLTICLLHLMK